MGFRSCARTPGCAKLHRVRRQTLIVFAAVLITAGGSLRAGTVTPLSDTEAPRLRAARPGAVVQLPEFLNQRPDLPLVPANIAPDVGPQFLFSDKPEYFLTGNGLALQEDIQPGIVRFYLYHVPTPSDERKTITAVIENLGDKALTLTFRRQTTPSPGRDYHQITKTALAQFLKPKPAPAARTLPVKARAPLDPRLDTLTSGRDDLVYAIYEFEITQPARVTVLQRDPEQKSILIMDELPKLPPVLPGATHASGAGRGLFLTSDFLVINAPDSPLDTANGPAQLLLADGQRDPWMRGHDQLSGGASTNVGNYGALYRIRLKRASSDGRGWALLMCQIPGHTATCGKIGAAVKKVGAGIWPAAVVVLPNDRVVFGGAEEAVLIQRFPSLPKGETDTIEITYSPSGACCLPTPLLFVPYEP
jgi:hypothetical protein